MKVTLARLWSASDLDKKSAEIFSEYFLMFYLCTSGKVDICFIYVVGVVSENWYKIKHLLTEISGHCAFFLPLTGSQSIDDMPCLHFAGRQNVSQALLDNTSKNALSPLRLICQLAKFKQGKSSISDNCLFLSIAYVVLISTSR